MFGLSVSHVYAGNVPPFVSDPADKLESNSIVPFKLDAVVDGSAGSPTKEDGCSWTKVSKPHKECNSFNVIGNFDVTEINNMLNSAVCEKVSIKNPGLACQCVENYVESAPAWEQDKQLGKIMMDEQDTSRRIELEKNLEKIIIREYWFKNTDGQDADISSCDTENRLKKLMSDDQTQNLSNFSKEKKKFCSKEYDPISAMNLSNKLHNSKISGLEVDKVIRAGFDLVVFSLKRKLEKESQESKESKNKTTITPEEHDNHLAKVLLRSTRGIIGRYLDSKSENDSSEFKKNYCPNNGAEQTDFSDLCNILEELKSYSHEQRKGLKIALETFTENNEAIEDSIKALINATKNNQEDKLSAQFKKIKIEKVKKIKQSLGKNHLASCDNVLGDKGDQPEIDSIKKYCFNISSKPKTTTIDNMRKIILDLENSGDLDVEKIIMKKYASYKYCGYVRSKLEEARKIYKDAKDVKNAKKSNIPEEEDLWIKEFMNSNTIPQACLDTDMAIYQSNFSKKIMDGSVQKPMTEMQKYISQERPNVFSRTPGIYKQEKIIAKNKVDHIPSSQDKDKGEVPPSEPSAAKPLPESSSSSESVSQYSPLDNQQFDDRRVGDDGYYTGNKSSSVASQNVQRSRVEIADMEKFFSNNKSNEDIINNIKNSNNLEYFNKLRDKLEKIEKLSEDQKKLIEVLNKRLEELEKEKEQKKKEDEEKKKRVVVKPPEASIETLKRPKYPSRAIIPSVSNAIRIPLLPPKRPMNEYVPGNRFGLTTAPGSSGSQSDKPAIKVRPKNTIVENEDGKKVLTLEKTELPSDKEDLSSVLSIDQKYLAIKEDFLEITLVKCDSKIEKLEENRGFCVLREGEDKIDEIISPSAYLKNIQEKIKEFKRQQVEKTEKADKFRNIKRVHDLNKGLNAEK